MFNSGWSLSLGGFYGNADFSDVTIKYSDREKHCHKIVICSKSEYFMKLCGPGSHFSESNQRVIELKEDDPDAVEAMINYMYTGNTAPVRPDDITYLLEVAKAANKYLVSPLREAALNRLRSITGTFKEVAAVFDAIAIIRTVGDQDTQFSIADELEKKHRSALLRYDKYRAEVQDDPSVMWEHMDHLNFTDDMEQWYVLQCTGCRSTHFISCSGKAPSFRCTAQKFSSGLKQLDGVRVWASNKEVSAWNQIRY